MKFYLFKKNFKKNQQVLITPMYYYMKIFIKKNDI